MKNILKLAKFPFDRIFFFFFIIEIYILLNHCMSRQKNNSAVKSQQQTSIMSKNVTTFKHFLTHSYITEKDIKWAINLRQYEKTKLKQVDSTPPSVYFKSTQLHQVRKNGSPKNFYNIGEYDHLTSTKRGKKYTQMDIAFHTNLRASEKDNRDIKDRFLTLPKKDRKQYPSFLNLKSLKKTRNISKQNFQTAFDGAQNYPKYHQRKILADKNIVNFQHLVKGKVNLPGIAWHVGLRNY